MAATRTRASARSTRGDRAQRSIQGYRDQAICVAGRLHRGILYRRAKHLLRPYRVAAMEAREAVRGGSEPDQRTPGKAYPQAPSEHSSRMSAYFLTKLIARFLK